MPNYAQFAASPWIQAIINEELAPNTPDPNYVAPFPTEQVNTVTLPNIDWGAVAQPSPHHQTMVQPMAYDDNDDDLTQMDISKTKLGAIFGKIYPKVPPALPVDQVFSSLKGKILLHNIKVPSLRFRFPELSKGHNTLVGLEIELENYQQHGGGPHGGAPLTGIVNECWSEVSKIWHFTPDSSLRNNGTEFVSKPGLTAGQAPQALAILRIWLSIYAPNTEFNYRTGTHVHVNVRDLTVEQLINLMMLYVLFEDSLYKCSGNRYRNIFCVPLRAASSSVERLMKLVHTARPTFDHLRRVFPHFKKYMAFNILPAGNKSNNPAVGNHSGVKCIGTVEFRHHEGESNPFVLIPWLQRLLDLHEAAQNHSFDTLKRTIFKLNSISNYVQFCDSVFSSPFPYSPEEIAADMYEGCGFIKELYLVSKGD